MSKGYNIKVNDRESFIKAATEKHGERFNYDKVVYKNQRTKVVIECKEHGEKSQTPEKHLNSKFGCRECAMILRHKYVRTEKNEEASKNKRISKEGYLERLHKRYGDKYTYDLSNYIKLMEGEVELNCVIHGKSTYNPYSLLQSNYGCRYCGNAVASKSKTLSYDDLLKEFKDMYGDKYVYLEENRETYLTKRSKIKFYCEEHDEISTKTAQKHLSGQYCYLCKLEEGKLLGKYPGGYTEDVFKDNKVMREKPGFIYFVKLGNIYKVGITINPKNRLKSLKSESKEDVEILYIMEDTLYSCYKLEQYMLLKYSMKRISTDWSTELFYENVLEGSSLEDENSSFLKM